MRAGWAVLFLAGCTFAYPTRLDIPEGTPERVRAWLQGYREGERPFPIAVKGTPRSDPGVPRRVEIRFPSVPPDGEPELLQAHMEVWLPAGTGRAPAYVVIHHLAGGFPFISQICRALAKKGVAAGLLYLPYYGPRAVPGVEKLADLADPDKLAGFLRRCVFDIRRARDALAALPEVDPDRVGMLGISLGALVGALAAGVDGRFAKVVLLGGGGDLASIIFHPSREAGPFRGIMDRAGLDEAACRKLLEPVEPLTYAPRVPADRVLMFAMEGDEVIPRRSTELLWDAFGRPRIEWLKGRHAGLALYVGRILHEAAGFAAANPGQ